MTMKIQLIAAVAENGVIGRNNDLPWKIRDDMRFFVRMTKGRTVITGRRNFEAAGALPKRHNIVVTRDRSFSAPSENVSVVHGLDAAVELARQRGETEVFIIGGAEIYALALPLADVFYRTRVLAEVEGDVVFPAFDESEWELTVIDRHAADADNQHPFVIERLTRRRS